MTTTPRAPGGPTLGLDPAGEQLELPAGDLASVAAADGYLTLADLALLDLEPVTAAAAECAAAALSAPLADDPPAPGPLDRPARRRRQRGAEAAPARVGPIDRALACNHGSPRYIREQCYPPVPKPLPAKDLRGYVRARVRTLWRRGTSLRRCGQVRYRPTVELRARSAGATAVAGIVAGVVRCGSIHSCLPCATRLSTERARILRAVVTAHRERTRTSEYPEGAVDMLTLTVPHDYGMRCKRLRRQVSLAWRRMQQSHWRAYLESIAVVGTVAARETTVGGCGWHPHIHILICHARPWTEAERARIQSELYDRWCAALSHVPGYRLRQPSVERGVVLTPSHKDDYLSKLGCEIANGVAKEGRVPGNRTPFQIQYDFMRKPTPKDAALLKEHAAAMLGARHLTWSRGRHGERDLRQIYADALHEPADEQFEMSAYEIAFLSDEEVVQAEDRQGVVLGALPGRWWDAIARAYRSAGRDAHTELAGAIADAGYEGVRAVLGQAYELARRRPDWPRMRESIRVLEDSWLIDGPAPPLGRWQRTVPGLEDEPPIDDTAALDRLGYRVRTVVDDHVEAVAHRDEHAALREALHAVSLFHE